MTIPQTLEPKVAADYAATHGKSRLLNSLADRGLILNTWQSNELCCPGNRGMGKTTLGYVRLAEEMRVSTTTRRCQNIIKIATDTDYTQYDPDAYGHHRRQQFVSGFVEFLETYYTAEFTGIEIIHGTGITAAAVTTKSESRRWWECN